MTWRSLPFVFLFALTTLPILSLSRSAFAEDNLQAAQALHDRAVQLMAQKNYAEACPKLEEVTRLVPDGIGAKLTLAECYEGQGKLASAWAQYTTVEQLAARQNQGERQRQASAGAARLKPRLAYLTIRVPPEVKRMPELKINRGTQSVGPAQFGEPIPIDKGSHTIDAIANGKKKWSINIDIPADGASLAVDVPILEDDPEWRLHNQPASSAGDEPTWLIPVGFAVGGAGAAALIVGGVLGGLALSSQSDAEDGCPNGFCTAEGNDARRQAGTFADASTGLFIAGGALAGAGIIMLALGPWSTFSVGAADVPRPVVAIGPGSLFVSGAFQ